MSRNLVALAALLMEAQPESLAVLVVVFNFHMDCRANAREGVAHQPDQGAVPNSDDRAGVDRIKKLSCFVRFEYWCLASLDDALGSPDRCCRVHGYDLSDHEPIEKHPDRGQVLLDRRR